MAIKQVKLFAFGSVRMDHYRPVSQYAIDIHDEHLYFGQINFVFFCQYPVPFLTYDLDRNDILNIDHADGFVVSIDDR